ncbi:MAG: hypothetical protein IT353_15065 [Gemmatimonadaceae bacterium]|nr:hypothetical protein [Gemmatimonadaceae bacterium]
MRSSLVIALLLALGASAHVSAQASPPPVRLAVDIGLGLGRVVNARASDDGGIASGTLLASRPVRLVGRGAILAAVGGSIAGVGPQYTACVVDCLAFLNYGVVTVLGGWAVRAHQASHARVFAGPAYFWGADSDGVGLSLRFDAAEKLTSRLSLAVWAQVLAPPAVRGDQLQLVAGGLGLRIR